MSGSASAPHFDIPGDTGLVVGPANVVPVDTTAPIVWRDRPHATSAAHPLARFQ
jgi:hypothetical protein